MKRVRFPIRLKFSLTFLVLVSTVLGVITFSTVSLFREDKKAYVNGLTSMVALGMAEESRSMLLGYHERLSLYTRLTLGDAVRPDRHGEMATTMFSEFSELAAVVVDTGDDPMVAYNIALLEGAGLTPEFLDEILASKADELKDLAVDETRVFSFRGHADHPMFLMAFSQTIDGVEKPAAVHAFLQSTRLIELVARFSAYDQFLLDSDGNYLAHSDPSRVAEATPAELVGKMAELYNDFSAGVTREFERDGQELIGGIAILDFAGMIAGAEIPMTAAHLASRQLVDRFVAVALLLLVAAIVCGVIFAHRVTRPMEALSAATRAIASGQFDIRVDVRSRDEINDLAASFNQMATELKTRDGELAETHTQLVQSEKMAAFGQLGAGIAHEVKNPLAGILACAQLAADEVEVGSTVHDDLKLIEKESNRCKEIIESLLKFARHEKTEVNQTNLNEVIEDSIAIVNHQLAMNEVTVEQNLIETLPDVMANANQLQQVFMNLLINAQQAMSGSPGVVRVHSACKKPGTIELRFEDTGPGIPEEIRNKIFEPFFTTKPTGQGTGLGLSVSYGIIRDHHGEIHCESTPGEGTTFVLELPVGDVTPSAEQV